VAATAASYDGGVLTRALALLAFLATGCGSNDSSTADMLLDLSVQHCPAIFCVGKCSDSGSHCVTSTVDANDDMGILGGCTGGQSTCGTTLTGDCNFTTRCLGPKLLGKLFIPVPEGGCGVELIACPNGCVDADGGTAPPHCAP